MLERNSIGRKSSIPFIAIVSITLFGASVVAGLLRPASSATSTSGNVYVSDGGLAVIKSGQMSVNETIALSGFAGATASIYDPLNQEVYVVTGGSISVVDTATNLEIKNIGVGSNTPDSLALDSKSGIIYAAIYAPASLLEINSTTNELLPSSVALNTHPDGVVYDPLNDNLYVTSQDTQELLTINATTNSVSNVITHVGQSLQDLAFDPANGGIYVSLYSGVLMLNTTTNGLYGVGGFPFDDYTWGLAYNSQNQEMYVSNLHNRSVSAINSSTNQVVSTVVVGSGAGSQGVGSEPMGLTYDSTIKAIYVANSGSGSIAVISSENQLISTINLGNGTEPQFITDSPATSTLNTTTSVITVTSTVTTTSTSLLTSVIPTTSTLTTTSLFTSVIPATSTQTTTSLLTSVVQTTTTLKTTSTAFTTLTSNSSSVMAFPLSYLALVAVVVIVELALLANFAIKKKRLSQS